MDLAQAVNIPEEITLADNVYTVRLLTMREWAAISAFIKKAMPSPVTQALLALQQAKAMGETLGQAAQDELLDHAQRAALKWPPKFGSDAWFDAIGAIDGGDAKLLLEVLGKTHLDFDEAKAKSLAAKLSPEEWSELLRVAMYGTQPRPKGDGGTAPPT